MPIQIEELCQLLYFDETSVTLVRPGDIVVWEDGLYHVADIKVKKGTWRIIGSWGERLSGPVRVGGGVKRMLRIPRDWLVRPEAPIIRRTPTAAEATAAETAPKREVDAELIMDIFRP